MKIIKLKICGMKYNTAEVAQLRPDYLGFIFYDKSLRNFSEKVVVIPSHIKKVGVFVNASLETISEKIKAHSLDIIQLHGEESVEFCKELKQLNNNPQSITIWKVFGIKDAFNFNQLKPYETVVDAYLFDTKGIKKGGNGVVFNWEVLKDYPSKKPFILSGGIGLDEIDAVKALLNTKLPLFAIDVNSKFETVPGKKDIPQLKKLVNLLELKSA